MVRLDPWPLLQRHDIWRHLYDVLSQFQSPSKTSETGKEQGGKNISGDDLYVPVHLLDVHPLLGRVGRRVGVHAASPERSC